MAKTPVQFTRATTPAVNASLSLEETPKQTSTTVQATLAPLLLALIAYSKDTLNVLFDSLSV